MEFSKLVTKFLRFFLTGNTNWREGSVRLASSLR
jgi:hypothetical protein